MPVCFLFILKCIAFSLSKINPDRGLFLEKPTPVLVNEKGMVYNHFSTKLRNDLRVLKKLELFYAYRVSILRNFN